MFKEDRGRMLQCVEGGQAQCCGSRKSIFGEEFNLSLSYCPKQLDSDENRKTRTGGYLREYFNNYAGRKDKL